MNKPDVFVDLNLNRCNRWFSTE